MSTLGVERTSFVARGYATHLCRRCNGCVSPFMGARGGGGGPHASLTGLPVVPFILRMCLGMTCLA
jgi:hypothetical protein